MASEIFTVSRFTRKLKLLLEETYPFIWITGEISNCFTPSSNHSYFSLKDDKAVISCVVFSGQKRNLKFELENGIKITGMARLSLYEPKGSYQLIFEHIEAKGTGSLQVSFEQLKKKLSEQGLFDQKYKNPLPFICSKISIITSPTGAAVQDIINVFKRRFNNCPLEIVPVKVQGKDSDIEIVQAIELVNKISISQLIILARGGGSFEDFSAFNTEIVAQAIFDSKIPIISGIGHEIDFSIADFVSDLRAPTPSAAAELALPEKNHLLNQLHDLNLKLYKNIKKLSLTLNEKLLSLKTRLKNPKRVIDEMRIKLDENSIRLNTVLNYSLSTKRLQINSLHKRLEALNPMAVLQRGYSITRTIPDKEIVIDSSTIKNNDLLETILYKGAVITRVEKENG
jgi:exodeoxyribonuclease VII large subunit